MTANALECRKFTSEWKKPLYAFLKDLETCREREYFRPHAFTEEALQQLLDSVCDDLYYITVVENSVLAYGMLRGWDQGYEVPSLGIAIHPTARRQGLGKLFMRFLHAAAFYKGANKVRLRVKTENAVAIQLYKDLGYQFQPDDEEFLIGYLDLTQQAR